MLFQFRLNHKNQYKFYVKHANMSSCSSPAWCYMNVLHMLVWLHLLNRYHLESQDMSKATLRAEIKLTVGLWVGLVWARGSDSKLIPVCSSLGKATKDVAAHHEQSEKAKKQLCVLQSANEGTRAS